MKTVTHVHSIIIVKVANNAFLNSTEVIVFGLGWIVVYLMVLMAKGANLTPCPDNSITLTTGDAPLTHTTFTLSLIKFVFDWE